MAPFPSATEYETLSTTKIKAIFYGVGLGYDDYLAYSDHIAAAVDQVKPPGLVLTDYNTKTLIPIYIQQFKQLRPEFASGIDHAQQVNPAWLRQAMATLFGFYGGNGAGDNDSATPEDTSSNIRRHERRSASHNRAPPSIMLQVTVLGSGKRGVVVDSQHIQDGNGGLSYARLLDYLSRHFSNLLPAARVWKGYIRGPMDTTWYMTGRNEDVFSATVLSYTEGNAYPRVQVQLVQTARNDDTNNDGDSYSDNDSDSDSDSGRAQCNLDDFLVDLKKACDKTMGRLNHVDPETLTMVNAYLPQLSFSELRSQYSGITLDRFGLNPNFRAQPYQIIAAVLAFHRVVATQVPGLVMVDSSGTSNSITAYLLHALRLHHAKNIADVQESRRSKDGRHLPELAEETLSCPSASKQAVACICTSQGRKLYPKMFIPGASLMLTKPWHVEMCLIEKDFHTVFEGGTLLLDKDWGLRVAIQQQQHGSIYNSTYTGPLTNAEKSSLCARPLVSDESGCLVRDVSRLNIEGKPDENGRPNPIGLSKGPVIPDHTKEHRDLQTARFMIITSPWLYRHQFLETRGRRGSLEGRETDWTAGDNTPVIGMVYHDYISSPYIIQMSNIFSVIKEQTIKYCQQVPALIPMMKTLDYPGLLSYLSHVIRGLYTPAWATIPDEDAFGRSDLRCLQDMDIDKFNEKADFYEALMEIAKRDPQAAKLVLESGGVAEFVRNVQVACMIVHNRCSGLGD